MNGKLTSRKFSKIIISCPMLPQRAEFENNLKIQKIPHKLVFKVNRSQKIQKWS